MIDCIASEPRKVLHGMRPRGPWLKVSDAADILGVAPVTLWKWRKAGMIDQVRTRKEGAYTYYHVDDIRALARRLESEGNENPAT